ncbi:hypothetical protein [Sphaerisporangium corydalis]|uniref:Uncharacterized protein n=1 Tax=Sphaerisporangium corydalis TaxID=1441875 RepID=A0ABV9EFF7_9ACTN|nr:hypothetical protein [Sphaerisporangium corydalis]
MLTVTFTGRTAIPSPFVGAGYGIWSYKVDPGGPGDLQPGQRIAIGLPRDVDLRGPEQFPGVPLLEGSFVQRDTASSRQWAGRVVGGTGNLTISFVAPAYETSYEVLLAKGPSSQNLTPATFLAGAGGTPSTLQVMPAPVTGPPVFNGRPPADFTGTLPYASEVFGVYQPLAGWFGRQNSLRVAGATGGDLLARLAGEAFTGDRARTLDGEALGALAAGLQDATGGVLSPVGLVNLFREYFFEFDTFLGAPAGHLWISPGGTVEVVETSTRRMLVERTAEQSEEVSRKVEESLTEQDDVADAVKEDNANDSTLGVSATGGVNAGVYHADASASFNLQTTVKRSSEQTHKHTRTQSAKVTSEIKRNYKTTFKTVTETTDTSSRRYVVQNTSGELVNYELRRKMRKVGVQLQHIGTRLSWQVYLDAPGRDLGLGELVHVAPAPDLTSVKKPDPVPYPGIQQVTHHLSVPFVLYQGADDEATDTYQTEPENIDHGIFKPDVGAADIIQFRFDYPLPPPPPGYALSRIGSLDFHGAQVRFTTDAPDLGTNPDPVRNKLAVRLTYANFAGNKFMPFDAIMVYEPTAEARQAVDKANKDAADAYDAQVAVLQREAYGNAVRDRLRLISSTRPRPSQDLRAEERQTVYGSLIDRLRLFQDPHLGSELIRQIFDVDEMLYFVAPDYWRPGTVVTHPTKDSVGRYPVPAAPWTTPDPAVLAGQTVAGWYSHTDADNALDPQGHATPEWRVNYLMTEETQPAPLGSSLGWLIQADGDRRRSEFLNAAWVKAVLPVRPGHELDALAWLAQAGVEGEAALGVPYSVQAGDPPAYQGKTVGEVLRLLATGLQASNLDISNTLTSEEVFETGFDPLDGGFRPAAPYEVFDQWAEVLPTDQLVAVQVRYDPKTGQQL